MDGIMTILDFLLYTVIPFVVVLGIMIFVHELGHFVAARLIGVRVLMFKLGFGKYILSFKRGHTEYGIGWIPIGGYVKMFGDPTEVEGGEEEVEFEDIPEEDKREALYYRPPLQKLFTFIAGPAMNIVLAFVIAPAIYMLGVNVVPPVVGLVESGSPAEVAGIEPGDRVLSIDGEEVTAFKDIKRMEVVNPEKTLTYVVQRGDEQKEIDVDIKKGEDEPMGVSGINEPYPAIVGRVQEGSPAEEAGLQTKDRVLSINGKRIELWAELVNTVKENEGDPLTIALLREGKEITKRVTPEYNEQYDRHLMGIGPYLEMEFVRYGFFESIVLGAEFCVEQTGFLFEVLGKLVTFQLSAKLMAGPLGIGAMTGAATRSGLGPLIAFTVLISINLGILNLLPFPPLDGGHILFTSLEGVMGREIKMKYKEAVFRVGFFLLITLMVLVTVNDVFRYKGRMWKFVMNVLGMS